MAPTELETKHVRVGDAGIAYHDRGEGRPVALVHGNFASKRWFRPLLEHPVGDHRFLALDLPNFGESEPLGREADLSAYAEVLGMFLDQLGIERAIVLGHSFGGAVVQTFAATAPERAAGMVLVSSPPPSGFRSPEGTDARQGQLRDNRDVMAQALAPMMPTVRPHDFDLIVTDALAMRHEAYAPHNRTLARMNLTDSIERVTCPVLVIGGGKDYLVTRAMFDELSTAYAQARAVYMEDVGHSPQLEAPARFRSLLAEFLEGSP